ncbi:MAG: type III secretion system gatekeeper subunit SctW [Deltaproteobacteria bacterium]|nr:type III secretion system gatekeeper subunit SctW [Deltaproteobacteria bacterium]
MAIESTQFTTGGVAPLPHERAGQAETGAVGLFMGAKVAVADNPMSLLADAAEELTFSLAESEESRLDERKEKTGAKRARSPFVEAAQKALQHLDEQSDRALNHLERLCKTRNTMELARLMQEVKRGLQGEGGEEPDPADQFTVLVGLKERLGAGHPLAETLDAALDALAVDEASAIASGLAVDLAAPDFAALGKERDLRDVYRGAVADFASPRDALTRLLDRFGQDRLNTGLDFLMTALGNEMACAGPSAETSRLKALTGDLAVVRTLGAVRMRCEHILKRLEAVHGVTGKAGCEALLDNILALRDNNYAGINDMRRITALVGLPDTEREVLLLQDMLQGLRELPDLFYGENEVRLRVLDAAQSALDDAVRREEEELGF